MSVKIGKLLGVVALGVTMGSFTGCSSSKEKSTPAEEVHSNIQRDYEVRDASNTDARPLWVSDAPVWAKDNGDLAKFRYFSYETEPKSNREVACELAKTNARSDIASEIASFIDKAVGSSTSGSASMNDGAPQNQGLREFIEVTLAEKTKALVHGASVEKVYWEKRDYQKAKGAKNDYIGYTCAALIKMDKDQLMKAVQEAANHVVKKADDPETKENVKEALKNVAEDFDKAKQGLI